MIEDSPHDVAMHQQYIEKLRPDGLTTDIKMTKSVQNIKSINSPNRRSSRK